MAGTDTETQVSDLNSQSLDTAEGTDGLSVRDFGLRLHRQQFEHPGKNKFEGLRVTRKNVALLNIDVKDKGALLTQSNHKIGAVSVVVDAI